MRHIALGGSLALLACSPSAPVVAPVTLVRAPVRAPAELPLRLDTLVLVGAHESVALDANGVEIDHADVSRIAVGRRVFTAKQEEASGHYLPPGRGCDVPGAGPSLKDAEFFSRSLALVEPSSPDLVLVAQEKKDTATATVHNEMIAWIDGVVGPYIFVSFERTYAACGITPLRGIEESVWDLRSRKEVSFAPPDETTAAAVAELQRLGVGNPSTSPEQLVPIPHARFDAQGRLMMRWRFEKGVGFEEADHLGRMQSISVNVDTAMLPPELAPFADPPAALAIYLQKHPGPIVGWSRLD